MSSENPTTQVLLRASAPDDATRNAAEAEIARMRDEDPMSFFEQMCMEIQDEARPARTRQQAGLLIKTTLEGHSRTEIARKSESWCGLAEEFRSSVKECLVTALGSPKRNVRRSAAQALTQVAAIEMREGMYHELLDILGSNVTEASTPIELVQSSIETIGYLCDALDPEDIDDDGKNKVLSAVVDGMRVERDPTTRRIAAESMIFVLDYVESNMSVPDERGFIMKTCIDAASDISDSDLVKHALDCLVKIGGLYYEFVEPHINELYMLTFKYISPSDDDESVALSALDFWNTLFDEESARLAADEPTHEFGLKIVGDLVPKLLGGMQQQEEGQTMESWNLSTACATCLDSLAGAAGDAIVPHVIPFSSGNVKSEDWRAREAAVLSFGMILGGPSPDSLMSVCTDALPLFIESLQTDPNEMVKDSAAWTIAQMCNLHTECIQETSWEPLLHAVLAGLTSALPVASNCAYVLQSLGENMERLGGFHYLGQHFQHIVEKLIEMSERPDANAKLRVDAYETINVLVQHSTDDLQGLVFKLLEFFSDKLSGLLELAATTHDERMRQNLQAAQGLICGVLQTAVLRLQEHSKPGADVLMNHLFRVFDSSDATAHMEAIMAISAIAGATGRDFMRYMDRFFPLLQTGLSLHKETEVCKVAVYAVGDVTRAIEDQFVSLVDGVMNSLFLCISDLDLDRSVKPPILSAFGDVALAVGAGFVKYIPECMKYLAMAGTAKCENPEDDDLMEFVEKLRESILECYTFFVQVVGPSNAMDTYVDQIGALCHEITNDPSRHPDSELTKGVVGLVGDMAHFMPLSSRGLYTHEFANRIIADAGSSSISEHADMAKWAQDAIRVALSSS